MINVIRLHSDHEALLISNQQDPTRTITLRNRWVADMTRRFRALMRDITTSIVDNDVFGIKEPVRMSLVPAEAAPPGAFSFVRNPQKVEGFMAWLREQEELGILEITTSPDPRVIGTEPWTNTYVRSSYQRGMETARSKLVSGGAPLLPFTDQLGGLIQAFNRPFHIDRVALIYTRAFNELKGITAAMDQQISRVLADGLSQGWGVQEMARKINNRVDKIGISRARTLARTEVVETFNEANIAEYEAAEGIIGEPIYDRWLTAQDERVRGSHVVRHGKKFEHTQALALIGEPNCRCALTPWIESINGERTAEDAADAKRIVKEKEK